MEQVLPQIEALASEGRVAMATLVGTRGTTPKKEGAKMFVGAGGRVLGSVTIGGCVDARVIAESEAVLAGGEPRLLSMSLGDEEAWEIGLSCGGTVEVLVEPLLPELAALYRRIALEVAQGRAACLVRQLAQPGEARLVLENESGDERAQQAIKRRQSLAEEGVFREVHAPLPQLVLVGAGQVAMSLCTLGHALGFRVTVIDARPRFASRERFVQADEIRVGIASELLAQLPLLPNTSVVITSHDYKVEVPVLRAVLQSPAGYVGMLGNKRRGRAVLEMLELPAEQLARVHVPVGLDIGAQTSEEIALSVLGQIVAVRAGKAP